MNYSVNEKGNLTLSGMDTVELAKEFGTPLYLMDENLIRENMQMYKKSIENYYGGKGLVCYASKAFSCKQIYRVVKDEDIGIDVVSTGELYTALSVDVNPANMCYHGNNKTVPELEYVIESNVGRIVADGFEELNRIDAIGKKMNKKVTVLLRLTPGIEAHTHEFVRTAGIDTKFGFPMQTGDAMKGVKHALTLENVNLTGVHCHIGSQIFDIEPFEVAADMLAEFIAEVKKETGHILTDLNVGGGFGIKYTDEDTPIVYDEYMKKVSVTLKASCEKLGIDLPFIIIEPGRSIVGSAGITVYEVGVVKDIPNVRKYVSIDGGMTDNIRYALYQSKYEFLIANKASQAKTERVAVVGRCCESGDTLTKDTDIQTPEVGDYLAVLATGAYNYSMSSNYNRVMKPAVVMLYNGKATVAVKRETLEDIVRNDI